MSQEKETAGTVTGTSEAACVPAAIETNYVVCFQNPALMHVSLALETLDAERCAGCVSGSDSTFANRVASR